MALSKDKKREIIILLIFLILYIIIRSIHFSEYLNFSFDQGWGTTRLLEIWRNKVITLVGPGSSIVVHGKQILQGSINYYFPLIFLLLGNWDPIKSSYFFMLFSGLMIIPLYLGAKYLINHKSAFLIILIYSLLPLFIDFSRFFFGPGFQLSILPLMILFMGLYRKTKKIRYQFLAFFTAGILSQFHYTFFTVTAIILLWYFFQLGNKKKLILVAAGGFTLGFLPIIVFELKNDFYNIRVFIEYLRFARNPANFALLPHRYLSLSLILIILIASFLKKYITNKLIIIAASILMLIDLIIYLPNPPHAFGMSENWNFLMEKKAYEIIKNQKNIKNYNIVNHIYDNKAVVVKFQMKRDGIKINYDDYYHEDYLYVISKTPDVFNDPAYELNTFKPNKKVGEWKLNDWYNLYLFQRLKAT